METVRNYKYAAIVSFALAVFGVGVELTGFKPWSFGRAATIVVLLVAGLLFVRQYKKKLAALKPGKPAKGTKRADKE